MAKAYIEHYSDSHGWNREMILEKRDNSDTEWAVDEILDMTLNAPQSLWEIVLEILGKNPPNEVLEVLAAGPLEDYLSQLGDSVIEQVEAEAARDRRFKSLLGGVWKNAMSDQVWARVQACWDRSEWDNGV